MDAKYNVQAASYQANQAQRLPITEAARIYERLLTVFPTAAKHWNQYAEAQMAANNNEATKNIFTRCLMNCLHVPLWLTYINFIRKVNANNGEDGQELTRKAFDFSLNYVGEDIASGPVWLEYIKFLKSLQGNQIVSLRKAYQKAIVTPHHYMDQLWIDYQNFERSINKDLAKVLLSEYSQKFNTAKAIYWERKKLAGEIDWGMLAVPPTGSPKEELQCMAWKKLLAFDRENLQRIDIESSNKRVVLTYEQCLMYLYHYPDMWYEYAMRLAKCGSLDAAVKVFERALKALPDSEMLRYAYAELEESRGAMMPAKKIYESLLGDGGVNTTPGLAQIQFLRFLRRTEGTEAARSYFLEARKTPNCTYNVYVAYATISLCLDKDSKLARNVFEAGMHQFMHDPEYILEYVDLLIRLNDDINTRALFERALCSMPPERSVELWNQFSKFEQTYGTLASMLKVELRKKEALSRIGGEEAPSSFIDSSLQDVVSRYSFRNLCPCSTKDLAHLTRQESLAKNMNKKVESSFTMPTEPNPLVTDSAVPVFAKVVYPATTNQTTTSTAAVPNLRILSQQPGDGNLQITTAVVGGAPKFDEILKTTPALAAFVANMPQQVEGPTPEVDAVLSFVLRSDIPSNSTSRKRKANEREVDDTMFKRQLDLPLDAFKMRQFQKSRLTASQTGSASYGSSSCSSGDHTVVTRNTI